MPASKLERLVNLLLMLLAARRPVTAEQIRAVVPGYEQADDESFRRMFERDKEELRDLGVPVETQPLDAWEDEVGYRIVRATYELPAIELAADEAAAVALAARLWQSAGLADASASALLKLRAAGVEADPVATAGIEPRVAAREAAFDPLLAAVRAARAVTFAYRPSYADEPVPRTVEPWGLVHRHGRWYVVGHDRDREATRVFKLSRISGDVTPVGVAGAFTVPAGVDLQAAVAPEETPTKTAVVRVAPDAAYDVRRAATSLAEDSDGWTRAEVPYGDLDRFAEWVVGFGADAVVVEPADARAAVVERLRALVAR